MKKISFWYVGIIALGLLFVGFFPGYYYYKSKFNYNAVTVKGLAETDVEANLAIWEIKFVETVNSVDYYYMIHYKTGKYLRSNEGFCISLLILC